jgi:hypothetical protein
MRNFLLAVLSAVTLLTGSLLRAQVTQLPTNDVAYDYRWEFYGGGAYTHFQAGLDLPSTNLYGFDGEAARYVRRHWAVVGSGRGYFGNTDVLPNSYKLTSQSIRDYMFLGGAQYRVERNQHLSLTLHALAGGEYGVFNPNVDYPTGGRINPESVGLYKNQMGFAGAFGGSVDFNLSERLALRIAPEATLTHFTGAFGASSLDAHYAATVGVIYKFHRGLRE